MKILFAYRVNQHSKKLSGVFQKLIGQMDALHQKEVEVYVVCMSLSSQILAEYNKGKLQVISSWEGIPADAEKYHFWKNAVDAVLRVCPDVLYARYDKMLVTSDILDFFKYLSSLPQVTKCLEFATYPYDKENKNLQAVQTDRQFREQLKPYVDCIFSTSTNPTILDKKNHYFVNQLSAEQFKAASTSELPLIAKRVTLLSVANITESHGFDRVIRGLANFVDSHPDIEIVYNIVGDGDHKPYLESLVNELELDEVVNFKGFLTGRALKEQYNGASIGIASLALHRKNLLTSSTLKVREYLANGLPVCIAGHDSVLENFQYKIEFSETDSPIDVDQIVSFISYCDLPGIRKLIRQFARKNISWVNWAELVLEASINAHETMNLVDNNKYSNY